MENKYIMKMEQANNITIDTLLLFCCNEKKRYQRNLDNFVMITIMK